jgi:hypothetical protein
MILSIILVINGIYTKFGNFPRRPAYQLSIISPIMTISKLSIASVYRTICAKFIVIAYKICYKQLLYFGIPGVFIAIDSPMYIIHPFGQFSASTF